MIHVLLGPAVDPERQPRQPPSHLTAGSNWQYVRAGGRGQGESADVVAATHSFKCHFKLK